MCRIDFSAAITPVFRVFRRRARRTELDLEDWRAFYPAAMLANSQSNRIPVGARKVGAVDVRAADAKADRCISCVWFHPCALFHRPRHPSDVGMHRVRKAALATWEEKERTGTVEMYCKGPRPSYGHPHCQRPQSQCTMALRW